MDLFEDLSSAVRERVLGESFLPLGEAKKEAGEWWDNLPGKRKNKVLRFLGLPKSEKKLFSKLSASNRSELEAYFIKHKGKVEWLERMSGKEELSEAREENLSMSDRIDQNAKQKAGKGIKITPKVYDWFVKKFGRGRSVEITKKSHAISQQKISIGKPKGRMGSVEIVATPLGDYLKVVNDNGGGGRPTTKFFFFKGMTEDVELTEAFLPPAGWRQFRDTRDKVNKASLDIDKIAKKEGKNSPLYKALVALKKDLDDASYGMHGLERHLANMPR